jgi:2,3,4,5-tetrahydropyridine-2-carboxylate N-succinyltransferase
MSLQQTIETAWDARAEYCPTNAPTDLREAVDHVLSELDAGRLRVASREGVGQWTVHQWIKKAVLLSFRLNDNEPMGQVGGGALSFFDKVPTKFDGWTPSGVPCRRRARRAAGRGTARQRTSRAMWC